MRLAQVSWLHVHPLIYKGTIYLKTVDQMVDPTLIGVCRLIHKKERK